jgi:hypothetical protein
MLRSGGMVSNKSLWLVYLKDESELTVFICESSGEDTGSVRFEVAGRSLDAIRKSGILVGFENSGQELEVEAMVKMFVSENREEKDDE